MSKLQKKITMVLLFTLVFLFSAITVLADEDITVYFDGEILNFDVKPIIKDGRVLVPMRTIFEKLESTVQWEENTKTITAEHPYYTITMKIGSHDMSIYYKTFDYSENFTLDVPATIVNGRTLVPLRAISEAFACQVGWDGKKKNVSIINNNYDLTMLYAPEGRSGAFKWSDVCAQLEAGWYDNKELVNYGYHYQIDSNFICKRCGKSVPPKLNMTQEEKLNAEKIHYISNREFWFNNNTEQFILTFSLTDSTEKIDIASPAIVRAWIINDDGETVYDRTLTVSSKDYGTWTKSFTGAQTFRCGIYIDKYEILSSTNKNGTLYFNVYNDYMSFDTYSIKISNDLPLLDSFVEMPIFPDIIHEYSYDQSILTSYKITDMWYETSGTDLIIHYSGEKTYDSKGDKYSRSCKIGWKLYDSEGYVIDSGTFYTPNIAVGEKFRDETTKIYNCIKPGEFYVLKISSVD